jgi:hypothetical protein
VRFRPRLDSELVCDFRRLNTEAAPGTMLLRWCTIWTIGSTEKVSTGPPMMLGGLGYRRETRNLQPFGISRTTLGATRRETVELKSSLSPAIMTRRRRTALDYGADGILVVRSRSSRRRKSPRRVREDGPASEFRSNCHLQHE